MFGVRLDDKLTPRTATYRSRKYRSKCRLQARVKVNFRLLNEDDTRPLKTGFEQDRQHLRNSKSHVV